MDADRWTSDPPAADVDDLTALLARHEEAARGWASSSRDSVATDVVGAGATTRRHLLVRDDAASRAGWARCTTVPPAGSWSSAVVDPQLDPAESGRPRRPAVPLGRARAVAVGRERGLSVTQMDTGAFADDPRQQEWLRGRFRAGALVVADDASGRPRRGRRGGVPAARAGVVIRRVKGRRAGDAMPDATDLRTVHDVLEASFTDHFNSHEERFEEFVAAAARGPRAPLGPLVDRRAHGRRRRRAAGGCARVVGAAGRAQRPRGQLRRVPRRPRGGARARGASSLLHTVVADAARRGRDRVGLEVDADNPTGAARLYLSAGFVTRYVTQSWHRDVPVASRPSPVAWVAALAPGPRGGPHPCCVPPRRPACPRHSTAGRAARPRERVATDPRRSHRPHLVVAAVLRWVLQRAVTRMVRRTVDSGLATHLGRNRATRVLASATGALSERRRQRTETLGSVLRSMITAVIFGIAFLMVLSEFSVNLAPLLASAGVAGVALGFGAQSLVKDFLSGLFMLLEDQYGVGDIIDAGEAAGTVEEVTLRVTKLRDPSGVAWYVRNGEIVRVANKSQGWSTAVVDLPVAYTEDVEKVIAIVRDVVNAMYADEQWSPVMIAEPTVAGVEQITGNTVTIRVFAKTEPNEQWGVQREIRERAKVAFDRAGVRALRCSRPCRAGRRGGDDQRHRLSSQAVAPPSPASAGRLSTA